MTAQKDIGVFGNRLNHPLLKVNGIDDPVFTKPASVVFALVVGLFVAARLWHLTAYSLWVDEIFSLWVARHDWSDLINLVIRDVVHPPLFYLLLKVWIGIGGESLLWLKLFPALTAIATIIPFFLLCRELKLRAAQINLALGLMAVNGHVIHYAQELRMYSLLLFLTLCSLWLFVSFFNAKDNSKKHLLAMFAVNLLLVYTQYYGWLIVGVEFIFLLFWGRRKVASFAIAIAILILCFSPWAYVVVQTAIRKGGVGSNLDWIGRPNLNSVIWYYAILNGTFLPRWKGVGGLLLFGYPLLLWFWHIFTDARASDKEGTAAFWWLSLLSFLPTALAFSASQVLPQSVWLYRALIIIAAPYMILVAIAVYRLRPNWVRTATVFLVVGWATLAGFTELNNSDRVAWEDLIRQIIQAEPTQANSIRVYTFQEAIATHLRLYLEAVQSGDEIASDRGADFEDLTNERGSQVVTVRDSMALNGEHFWVAFRESREKKERPLQEILTDSGYQVGKGFESGPPGHKVFLFPVWRR